MTYYLSINRIGVSNFKYYDGTSQFPNKELFLAQLWQIALPEKLASYKAGMD
jgi:hypothetical protein